MLAREPEVRRKECGPTLPSGQAVKILLGSAPEGSVTTLQENGDRFGSSVLVFRQDAVREDPQQGPARDQRESSRGCLQASWPHKHSFLTSSGIPLHVEAVGAPLEAELAGRGHIADQRRGSDDGGTGEVTLAADAH